jgi:hypothetical protein
MFETVVQDLAPFASAFRRHGKQIYLVGGAVRNLLLGTAVKDYDFTTDAVPTEVMTYFRKVLPTGLQHGTVTVLFEGGTYEVTTFRVDGTYTDGRRPDGVTFTPSLEEDLKRRDFTINALAINLADGTLVDFHDGQGDLARRVLRAIGDPGQRFDEDALRILRLFRFASQLGFSVDPPTGEAVGPRRPHLAAVSRERIREELNKALAGPRPELAWGPLDRLGILGDLFPSLGPQPLGEGFLNQLSRVSVDLRWSFWLTVACRSGRSRWEKALRTLTFSNADLAAALGPPLALDFLDGSDPLTVTAKAIIEAWGDRSRVGPGCEFLSAIEEAGLWTDTNGLKQELTRVRDSGEPVFVADLALGGRDLLDAGVPPGPSIGQTLRGLQREVWADPGLNVSDRLRERLLRLR